MERETKIPLETKPQLRGGALLVQLEELRVRIHRVQGPVD